MRLFQKIHTLCLFSVFILTKSVTSQEKLDYAKLSLDTNILRGSRWAIEQRQQKKLIEVFHAVEIVDISKVDVDTMSIRIEIHLRQRWEQEDLDFPFGLFSPLDGPNVWIQANPKILDSIWSPDSYIPIARDTKIASVSTQQSIVNLFQNRSIVYKARMYTILGCLFDFSWYPLDKQICNLTIESYTQDDNVVRYLWETTQEPVVYSNLKLLQYDLKFPLQYDNGTSPRWGRSERYPYVNLMLAFERQLGHLMIQVFIPTSLVVILSWFSFWLGLDAVPGRISLLITAMLTLVTMHSAQKGAIPPVNYIKMMDIWMVGCIAFVFLALCEFVIVKYIHWRLAQKTKAAEEKEQRMKDYFNKMREVEEHNKVHTAKEGKNSNGNKAFNPYLEFYRNMSLQEKGVRQAWMPGTDLYGPLAPGGFDSFGFPGPMGQAWPYPQNPSSMEDKTQRPIWVTIDRISRVLFPFTFLVFNAVFWPWLIIGAANQ